MPKFSINFQEILSRAHGNFEEQNKVLKPSIIINYCIIIIIIIIVYYNCTVQLMQYDYTVYYISNKAWLRNVIRKKIWK